MGETLECTPEPAGDFTKLSAIAQRLDALTGGDVAFEAAQVKTQAIEGNFDGRRLHSNALLFTSEPDKSPA
jgi:hypothetical protein